MKRAIAEIGGIRIPYAFHWNGTQDYFGKSIIDENVSSEMECIQLDTSYLKEQIGRYPDHSPQEVEFSFLVGDTGNVLLRYNSCLFHGVAFILSGKAIILTGPSGVGKTTQYLNWKKIRQDEIKIINGDKLILKTDKDGSIWVVSSPWHGKEKLYSDLSAPLGGIVCLKQRAENSFKTLEAKEAICDVYRQVLYAPYSGQEVHNACSFVSCLLSRMPLWEFCNTGDISSTEFLRSCLLG